MTYADLLRAAAVRPFTCMHEQQDFRTLQSMRTEHLPLRSQPNTRTLDLLNFWLLAVCHVTFQLSWVARTTEVDALRKIGAHVCSQQAARNAGLVSGDSCRLQCLVYGEGTTAAVRCAAIVCAPQSKAAQSLHASVPTKTEHERPRLLNAFNCCGWG